MRASFAGWLLDDMPMFILIGMIAPPLINQRLVAVRIAIVNQIATMAACPRLCRADMRRRVRAHQETW